MCEFEIAPRRCVDLNRAIGAFPLRQCDQRQVALLGDFQIFDDGAHRGNFSPTERAEGIQRRDAKQGANPFL